MSDQPKTVLVTGGAGFIGSFLCESLLKEGNRVICIDNFSTGHVRNIEPYLRNPNFQFLKLDINKPFRLDSYPELEPFQIQYLGIQEIYHLASPTSIKNFDEHKIQTLLSHSVGTYHVLEAAVAFKSSIVLGSSSVVYGGRSSDKVLFTEEDEGIVSHLTPRACYDEGKRFAETMMYTYASEFDLDAKIARIFRAYGPRMPLFDGHQISDFIMSALNGEDVEVNGDEEMKTSLVYVNDVVDGLIRLMRAKKGIGPVNIGSDLDLKLADVARQIVSMVGTSNSKVVFKENLHFLTDIGLPNITRAKEELGWLPLVRLEDGLQKTIDYIRANKILLSSDTM